MLYGIAIFWVTFSLKGQVIPESGFTRVEGLSTNVLYCVMQDSRGFIWIGTDAGVSRYDGYSFKSIGMADGLSDNEVFQIVEDNRNRLWFLTYNGEPTLLDSGRLYNASNTDWLSQVKPGEISRGLQSRGDSIWYTSRNKAFLFVKDQLRKELPVDDLYGPGSEAYMELVNCDTTFLLLCRSVIYYPSTGKKILVPPAISKRLPYTKVLHLDGNLYFILDNKLLRYQPDSGRLVEFQLPVDVPINNLSYSVRDRQLYLLTQKGLFQYDPNTDKLQLSIRFSIPFTTYVFSDRNGNTWIASQNQGLFTSRPPGVHLFQPHTALNTQTVYSLASYKGRIYAGMINGEFLQWDGSKLTQHKTGVSSELNKIYGFKEVGNHFLGIAGTGVFSPVQNTEMSYGSSVKALAVSGEHLYIALSFGVVKATVDSFLRNQLGWNLSKSTPVYHKRVNTILARGDSAFLGGLDGLKLLVKESLRSLPFQDRILNSRVTAIREDAEQRICFTTSGEGLGIISQGKLFTIDEGKGLISNTCNAVVASGTNQLWVATNKGVSSIHYQIKNGELDCTVRNYGVEDGLPAAEVNDIVVQQDTVWLATNNGLAYFNPGKLRPANKLPLVLERVLINGTDRLVRSIYQLAHYENNIQIEYTGLAFASGNEFQYCYRLIGADTTWSTTTNRSILFAGMAPGAYRFQVAAGNAEAIDETGIREIRFTIHPPFWQTPGFRILSALLLIILLGLYMGRRLRRARVFHQQQNETLRLRTQHAESERASLERDKQLIELKEKALALQMNPHFIFNAINSIKGYYSANDKAGAERFIQQFSGLMRLILEKNSQSFISLHDELDLLRAYLSLAAQRQPGKFEFELKIGRGLNTRQLLLPPMLIQPFAENAVIHGMATRETGGMIKIVFSQQGNQLVCEVLDNGEGIQAAQQRNKYKLRESKGIDITRSRLKLISPTSKLEITDIVGADGQVEGTRVEIRIPVNYKPA